MNRPDSSEIDDSLSRLRGGMVWFAAGTAVILLTLWWRHAGLTPLARYGPLAAVLVGAYGVVLGLEKMVGGHRLARRLPAEADRSRTSVLAGAGLVLVLLAVTSVVLVHRSRAPYWGAIEGLSEGRRAEQVLQDIAHRHSNVLQAAPDDATTLDSWRRSADEALPLLPAFAGALDASRYLVQSGNSREKAQARIDVEFYELCLEWMDLYREIARTIEESSLVEPPPDWGPRQDSIVDRINALPQGPDASG